MTIIIYTLAAIVTGFFIDLVIGDPYFMPHPVRLMGRGIDFMERLLRKMFKKTPKGELAGGAVLAIVMVTLSGAIPFFILYFSYRIDVYLFYAVQSIMCYQIMATKSLRTESMRVYHALKSGDLNTARAKLSMIVGRDTQPLDEEGVIRAAVETVAENTTDGVIAPLIYMFIGGAVLGFVYKAVNTMDSMIGYRNEKYLYFGRVGARLDDLLNYIPSRIAAMLMIISAWMLRLNGKNAKYIFQRDRNKHASPNSAQTESVCAGALGIRLGGDAYYGGILKHKPFIGDALRSAVQEDIVRANRLLYLSALIGLFIPAIAWSLVIIL